jgi:hypothetical protein
MQYADDTNLMVKSKYSGIFREKAERAVANILSWFKANMLVINVRKSKFIVFGSKRAEIPSLQIGSQVLLRCDEVKYLGLRIDSRLRWNCHIQYVISRIRLFTCTLFRLKCALSISLKIFLAKTLILPIIDLHSFVYGTATSADLHRLDVAYNDLIRCILGKRRSERIHVSDLYRLTNMEALEQRRNVALKRFMSKVVNEQIYSKMRLCCVKHNSYATRSNTYVIPRCSTNIGSHRVCVRGLKLLNQAD